mgnify:CR=1 FL=1
MSEVKSKVPGVVDEVKAAAGDKIEKGQVVIVLEAMKMKVPVVATASGQVTSILVAEGDPVEIGQVLITIG